MVAQIAAATGSPPDNYLVLDAQGQLLTTKQTNLFNRIISCVRMRQVTHWMEQACT